MAPSKLHDPAFRTWFSTYHRLGASPGAVIALDRMNSVIDVRHLLPAIRVPTLVLNRIGTGASIIEPGRYVATHIPGAKLVELPGSDYLTFAGDIDALVDEIEAFVTGARPSPTRTTVLATVMVIEIVDAAGQAIALGDRRWGDLLQRFHSLARREINRFRGGVHASGEDRLVATFDGPARAIRCASAINMATRGLGLTTHAGLHTGECEVHGDRVGGIAAPIAAWVASQAALYETLVSGTVKDLAAGAEIRFLDRGARPMRGGAGEWRLHAVLSTEEPLTAPMAEPPPCSHPRAELTRRERDVLPLVARGLSNRQIADQLSIGERTAESHVASILSKWRLASRAQLATAAAPASTPIEEPSQR